MFYFLHIVNFFTAKLNEGSQAQIFISPSDDAYGVYQFLPESLAVTVYEPKTDSNTTTLKVFFPSNLVTYWNSAYSEYPYIFSTL